MIIPIPKKSQEKPLSTHLRLRSSFTPDSGVNICFKVVSGTFYRRSLGDGGCLRSSRCRRSRVRAAHATCAACMRALPARLCTGVTRCAGGRQCDAAQQLPAVSCASRLREAGACLTAPSNLPGSFGSGSGWGADRLGRLILLGAPALTDPYLRFLCDKEFVSAIQTSTNRLRAGYGPSALGKPGLAGLAG